MECMTSPPNPASVSTHSTQRCTTKTNHTPDLEVAVDLDVDLDVAVDLAVNPPGKPNRNPEREKVGDPVSWGSD